MNEGKKKKSNTHVHMKKRKRIIFNSNHISSRESLQKKKKKNTIIWPYLYSLDSASLSSSLDESSSDPAAPSFSFTSFMMNFHCSGFTDETLSRLCFRVCRSASGLPGPECALRSFSEIILENLRRNSTWTTSHLLSFWVAFSSKYGLAGSSADSTAYQYA